MLADPLTTLDAVRSRLAGDYRRWLTRVANDPETHAVVIDWRLPYGESTTYPLGWLLGTATRNAIGDQVSQTLIGDSGKQLEKATGWKVSACDGRLPGLDKSMCEDDVRSGRR